jgi:hypothetical protein
MVAEASVSIFGCCFCWGLLFCCCACGPFLGPPFGVVSFDEEATSGGCDPPSAFCAALFAAFSAFASFFNSAPDSFGAAGVSVAGGGAPLEVGFGDGASLGVGSEAMLMAQVEL